VATNETPGALGCPDFARGFPYCEAQVEGGPVGYQHLCGWLQVVEHSAGEPEGQIDQFPILVSPSHPFVYFGYSPAYFDAPHTNELEKWDFRAHTFYCGLGGELTEFRKEARAILGFGWGFSKRGREIEWFRPERLSPQDWDGHIERLSQERPEWSFKRGFSQHPLEP
jgi:hypothetical protein